MIMLLVLTLGEKVLSAHCWGKNVFWQSLKRVLEKRKPASLEGHFDLRGNPPSVCTTGPVTSWDGSAVGFPGSVKVAWGTALLSCPSYST